MKISWKIWSRAKWIISSTSKHLLFKTWFFTIHSAFVHLIEDSTCEIQKTISLCLTQELNSIRLNFKTINTFFTPDVWTLKYSEKLARFWCRQKKTFLQVHSIDRNSPWSLRLKFFKVFLKEEIIISILCLEREQTEENNEQ